MNVTLFKILWNLWNRNELFDLGIRAYLLNLSQSSYTPKGPNTQKEYIRESVFHPGKSFLEKIRMEKHRKNLPKIWNRVCLLCPGRLLPMLTRENRGRARNHIGMWQVYTDVQTSSCIYSGFMEKCGVCVKERNWKHMAKRLSVQSVAGKADLHEKAGGEFNINSPKRLFR